MPRYEIQARTVFAPEILRVIRSRGISKTEYPFLQCLCTLQIFIMHVSAKCVYIHTHVKAYKYVCAFFTCSCQGSEKLKRNEHKCNFIFPRIARIYACVRTHAYVCACVFAHKHGCECTLRDYSYAQDGWALCSAPRSLPVSYGPSGSGASSWWMEAAPRGEAGTW